MIAEKSTLPSRRRAVPFLACVVLALAVSGPARAEDPTIAPLIAQLRASDWRTVSCAKEELEFLQEKSIPALMDLLGSREVVKLTETMDLIYPGAESFYGHGEVIPYDLDTLAVRAGWVLEAITFQDFGFRSDPIEEEALFRATMAYGMAVVPLEEALGPRKPADPGPAIARARAWWAQAGRRWTRYQGVHDALESGNPTRLYNVLLWLREGDSSCEGLTETSYKTEIRPKVAALTGSPSQSVRNQVELLLQDRGPWFKGVSYSHYLKDICRKEKAE